MKESKVALREKMIHCNSCDNEKMHIMILYNDNSLDGTHYFDLSIWACKKCGSTRIDI